MKENLEALIADIKSKACVFEGAIFKEYDFNDNYGTGSKNRPEFLGYINRSFLTVRAEPLLSQHRQKPWVSMAEIFVVEDSISHADGELSGPVVWLCPDPLGLNGKCQTFK